MIAYFLFVLLSAAPPQPCLVLGGNEIRATDLAPRLEVFQSLAPTTVFALAPNFGVRRDISAQTLARWAARHNLPTGPYEPLCVYRAIPAPEINWAEAIRDNLKTSYRLAIDAASIEVQDPRLSRAASGELLLPPRALSYDTRSSQYVWLGKLGGSPIKLQFQMPSSEKRWVAARSLGLGEKIVPADLQAVSRPWKPGVDPSLESLGRIEGRVLRRSLPKGALLLEAHFIEAPLIEPGDAVDVVSEAGLASIKFAAIARGKARLGEPLLVATVEGKKLLRAIATGRGEAKISSGFGKKLQ